MAKTLSTMMPLGTRAPDFSLPDTISAEAVSLQSARGEKGTLIMFICNHCPFVIHIDEALVALAKDYQSKGIAIIAISANDIENYPQDGPEKMREKAQSLGYTFPYLYDESQAVAKAYDAVCTPDLFLFDADLACYYRGQFDASRPSNDIPVSGQDLRKALDNLLAAKPTDPQQTASVGCNIKWKQA